MNEEPPLKVSDLIAFFQKILKEHGDINVCGYNDEFGRLYPLVNDGRGPEFMVLPNKYRPMYGDDDWDKSKKDEYYKIEYPIDSEDHEKSLTDTVLVI